MSLFLSIISVFLLISPTFIIIFGVKSLERLINQTYIQYLSFGNTEHRYLVPCYITNHYPVKKKNAANFLSFQQYSNDVR